LLGYSARLRRAGVFAAVLLVVTAVAHGSLWADTGLQDVTRTPITVSEPEGPILKKFAGSVVEVSSYVGSGSFYASGYRDPYASVALFVRPTYDLGTRYDMALSARLYVEDELTQPDNPNGRHLYPYDPWLWFSARNLHTFERSKIRIGGLLRIVLPLSYESRYQHLVFGVGAGINVNRAFLLGKAQNEAHQWKLALTYGLTFYKYVQTSEFRGSGPGDTSGCRAPQSASLGGETSSGGDPSVSSADRCGGPTNPNFAFANSFVVAISRGRWSLLTTLVINNSFAYDIGNDQLTAAGAVAQGRTDSTWGIIALGYEPRAHLGVSAGVSSLQPALDARNQYPRFPFFDLSGGANANNFTQVFVSVNGSL
jgi:hypothetical protein